MRKLIVLGAVTLVMTLVGCASNGPKGPPKKQASSYISLSVG